MVVGYLDPLTTQDLKSSGFPDVLGRRSKSEAQRVNNTGVNSIHKPPAMPVRIEKVLPIRREDVSLSQI
jgi:hypothetical protein